MQPIRKSATRSGRLRLIAAVLCLVIIWLGLLPWLAGRTSVARHIRLQKDLGIDPSAMFYSELDIVPDIAHRMERLQLLQSTSGRVGEDTGILQRPEADAP